MYPYYSIYNLFNFHHRHPQYSMQVVTPPASECVSAADLKTHIRYNEDDATLSGFISAAREHFEHLTDGRIVLPTTFTQSFEDWDYHLRLAMANISSVTSVNYYDENDIQQPMTTGYSTDLTGCPGLLWRMDQDYPALSQMRPRPVSITFVAGWADTAHVPATVIQGIKMLAAHYARQREAYGEVDLSVIPSGFQAFCMQFQTGLSF